jgi:hypothetical protein
MASAAVDPNYVNGEWVGAAIPMSLREYLRTMFHPDRDYVDGFAEERNVGEYEHGKVQYKLIRLLVRPDRFRVLDVMVLRAGEEVDRYPTTAPLICIEVLSSEDRWPRLREVLDDYVAMGPKSVWAFDPAKREAFVYGAEGFSKRTELVVEGTAIRVDVAEVFSVLK